MIGITLRQRYKIIQQLQAGGFGETFLAEDLDIPASPKPKCVVKRLKPKTVDADVQRLFEKEAEILYKLGQKHDQIPKLYAYFEENQEFYLVQELIDGHDLSQDIIEGKQWSEAEVIQFLQDILEVLAFVHQHNVIHRDIKPSNIMRRRQDSKLILIDFGIVKEIRTPVANASGLTTHTVGIGTFGYMPSEQALGKPRLSSDIYAVGMTAIQALTGVAPYELPENDNGELIWQECTQVSNALAKILSRMVRYHFNQRYRSAVEALQDLTSSVIVPTSQPAPPPVTLPKSVDQSTLAITQSSPSSIASPQSLEKPTPPASPSVPPSAVAPRPVRDGSKWGYKDQIGRFVIKPQFDRAGKFSEGLAPVKIGSKYGYIDQTGQVIIAPRFDKAEKFSEGLASVKLGEVCGYVDKGGRLSIQPRPGQEWNFSEGLAVVKLGNWYGYVDQTGQIISELFDEAMSFSEGLAAVKVGSEWGYIDKTGQLVIQPQFSQVGSFSQGKASVEVKTKLARLLSMGEQWRTIDKIGRFI